MGKAYYFQGVVSLIQGTRYAFFSILFADAYLLILLYSIFRLRFSKNKLNFNFSKNIFLLFPLVVFSFISAWNSNFFSVALFGTFEFLRNIIIFLVSIIVFLYNKRSKRLLIELVVIFILSSSVLTLVQGFKGGLIGLPVENTLVDIDDELGSIYRPSGMFMTPNLSASLSLLSLPMVIYLVNKTKLKKKSTNLILLFFISLIILSIIFTASRTNLILLGISLYFLDFKSILLKFFKLYKKMSIILISFFLLFSVPIVLVRMLSIENIVEKGGAIDFRLLHITESVSMILDKPLGIGLNTFQYEVMFRTGRDHVANQTPAHNFFAESLAGLGVIGFIVFIYFLYLHKNLIFKEILSKKISIEWVGSWVIILYLLSAQIFTWFADQPISAIFWMFLALLNTKRISQESTV